MTDDELFEQSGLSGTEGAFRFLNCFADLVADLWDTNGGDTAKAEEEARKLCLAR